MYNSAFTLNENPKLRYFTFFYLYVMQGVPTGFALTTMANYLVAKNVSSQAVGSFIAIVGIPWVAQFIWGPIIDRYQYSVIGHRKHWVVLTQIIAVIASLGLLLVQNPVQQLFLLGLMFFIHSCFASVQDASVDAMAIFLVPEAERGRVNAFMRGGFLMGIAIGAAGLSSVLHAYNFASAVMVQSALLLFFTILFFFTKLDRHDLLLPSFGNHHLPVNNNTETLSLKILFNQLFAGLFQKKSLQTFGVIAATYFCFSVFIRSYSYYLIHNLKWPDQDVSVLQGSWGSIATFLVIISGGVLADRIGHAKFQSKVMYGLAIYLFVLNGLMLVATNNYIAGTGLVIWNFADPLFSVAAFPILMKMCSKQVEGSQFTAYMALVNFCDILGSYVTGWLLHITLAPVIGLCCGLILTSLIYLWQRLRKINIELVELPV
ncbi:MAG: MFS transporter [Sphingobacteriaceae bacterium]|nr:MAG: MFS transporter [Sphingobacteriaceae bacterium]